MQIENKKAYHDYFVDDIIECGIVLKGNEVKSIRKGSCSIKEAWVTIQNNELILRGCHITKYETANMFDVNEKREKILLAHKQEIHKLNKFLQIQGNTLIPLKIYFAKNGKCKVLVGLCRGKHNYDKRETLKEKDTKRQIDRYLKNKE